jgi:hypothetical protein
VRQIQENGLDLRLPVFQERLNHTFIFIRVVSAGGIKQGSTRFEKIKSPEQKVTLKAGQFIAGLVWLPYIGIGSSAQGALG